MTGTRPLGLGKSSAFGQRGITKRINALLAADPLFGDRLLDIGCGDGAYTRILAERFGHTDAIDIQADRLDLFRQDVDPERVTVAHMSADRLRFPDSSFDAVTAIEVLEHVDQLDTALAEVARVLRPGGILALTTPNRWFPFETHGPILFGRRRRPLAAPFLPWLVPLHSRCSDARSFTRRGLARRVAAAGLRVESVGYLFPPFDRSRVGQAIAPFTDRLESTPLRVFGMALVVMARKPF